VITTTQFKNGTHDVRVPLFANVGDRVPVDTRSGEHVSRA
jgi:hypothetical protein